jgi:hypothetical protein
MTDLERVEEEVLTIRITADSDRMGGMSNKTLRTVEKSPAAQYDFVAHFMTDEDGNYLDYDDAIEILDELTVDDLNDAFKQIQAAFYEAAAPKKSGRKSTKRRGSK